MSRCFLTLNEYMKENRRKWVKALRFGNYEKGQNVLRKGDRYCCLGVLATVAGVTVELDPNTGEYTFDGKHTSAPISAMAFVGLATRMGSYTKQSPDGKRLLTSLAIDNDQDFVNFDDIADIIEAEPEGLFIT